MKIVEGESRAKFVRKVVGLLAGVAFGVGSAFAGNIGSGGDISYVDDGSGDVIHVFLTSGTFVSPPGEANVRVLLVGGGGGAGSGTSDRGGGAGAGGFVYDTGSPASLLLAESTVVPVTVGAGGTHGASSKNGQDGGASSFAAPSGTLSAAGGGGGKYGAPGSGGSTPGAGAGCGSPAGFNGGSGGGAGGDADSTYCWPSSDRKAGRGGPGLASDITGVSVTYGGGGGGGYGSSWMYPRGAGQDGGADGAYSGSTNKGTDGRGGGGGGSMGAGAGGDGGSGIVIVRYHPVEAQISAAITVPEVNSASARFTGELSGSGTDDDWLKIYIAVAPIADDLPTPTLVSNHWTIGESWSYDHIGLTPCVTYRYLVRLVSSNDAKTRDYTGTFTTVIPPATGGDATAMMVDGSHLVLFSTVGSRSVTFPAEFGAINARYLIVGGGGSAGPSFIDRGSGGGGGGGVLTNATVNPLSIAAGATLVVTVGEGGANPTQNTGAGNNGTASSIVYGDMTLTAGGGTAGRAGGDSRAGGNCPGGGSGCESTAGNNGGAGGGAGGNAYSYSNGGYNASHGGPGAYCDITGEDVCYGGGGGGGYGNWNAPAGVGGIGGGGDGGSYSRYGGTNGLGGGGGGSYGGDASKTFYGGGGGSGFVAIRYTYVNPTASALPDEPYGIFESAEITPNTTVALGYRAYWAGATSQRVRVEAYYGLDAGSLTGKVVLADSAIGSGTAELAFPLAPEPRTFYFRLAFISADGTTAPSTVRSVTMPTITAFTAPAPVIDAKARTIAFRGTVGPFGVGSTTLKLAYGRTAANLTEQLTLATGTDGGAAVQFDSGTIACGKPVRMSELYYRYVLEEIYNGTVVQREVVGPVKVRVYTPGLVVYFQ